MRNLLRAPADLKSDLESSQSKPQSAKNYCFILSVGMKLRQWTRPNLNSLAQVEKSSKEMPDSSKNSLKWLVNSLVWVLVESGKGGPFKVSNEGGFGVIMALVSMLTSKFPGSPIWFMTKPNRLFQRSRRVAGLSFEFHASPGWKLGLRVALSMLPLNDQWHKIDTQNESFSLNTKKKTLFWMTHNCVGPDVKQRKCELILVPCINWVGFPSGIPRCSSHW